MPIKIVVADDQHVNRKALVFLLQSRPDYEVCAQAANGGEALRYLKFYKPDVLLLDLNMPIINGFQVLEALQKENSPVKTIVVSMNDDSKNIARCMELGARGFLSLFNETDEEQTAIDSVMENGIYVNNKTSIALVKDIMRLKRFEPHFDAGIVHFDEEQMRVLDAFARGLSNVETGNEICASDKKVEKIKHEMVVKLGVKNFMGVLIYAHQKGLIDLDNVPVLYKSKASKFG